MNRRSARRGVCVRLITLGELARLERDFERAVYLYDESLALLQQVGDRWFIAIVLHNLGQVAQDQGRYAEAEDLFNACWADGRMMTIDEAIAHALERVPIACTPSSFPRAFGGNPEARQTGCPIEAFGHDVA